MEIFLNKSNSDYLETISLDNLDNFDKSFKNFSSLKIPLEAKIFAINESISSYQLSKFKKNSDKFNICSLSIYSNNRDTILAGKSLKINSTLLKNKRFKISYFYPI